MTYFFTTKSRQYFCSISLFFSIFIGAQTPKLAQFDFDSTQDTSNTFTGSLQNGATLLPYEGHHVLALGDNDGYFDFSSNFGSIIAQLDNFSISTNLYISSSYNISNFGNFVWTFANSTNMAATANGNIFFGAISSRYAISTTHWQTEEAVDLNQTLPQGRWINLIYTQLNGNGKIYIDGNLMAQANVNLTPSNIGATPFNFLGRSCYNTDKYLKTAQYDNFIVYDGALTNNEIDALAETITPLNNTLNSLLLNDAANALTIENADAIKSNLILPTQLAHGISVSWASSNSNTISSSGIVTRPPVGSNPVSLTLTATLQLNGVTVTKTFNVTVLPLYSDIESLQIDLDNLTLSGNTTNIRDAIHLPTTTQEGSMVVWSSNEPNYLNNVGKVQQLSAYGNGKKQVMLTATLIKNNEKGTKTFTVWVAEKENRDAYLFSYFTGNDANGEQIRFAVSNDGYHYTPLNNGQPIISSDTISIKKGVRDPHILRGEDGETFYMVVTDMKSAEGWSSNRGMVLLKSNDLVNWTHSTVHFPTKWPTEWGNVLRVWAPQTIYDPVEQKYMVYFSLWSNDSNAPYDRIYYCYANEDFTDLIGTPKILFDRGTSTIDGDIVFNEQDNLYHMFFKNEALGGISKVTSTTLTAPLGQEGTQWSNPSPPVQQTNKAVEGSGVFRLIDTNNWILMYDCYSNGHYQFCSSTNLTDFSFVRDNYDMDARHGTTIAITREEAARLTTKWPSAALNPTPEGAKNKAIKKYGFDLDTSNQTINIAVNYGTDITNFNPELFAAPGTIISPTGEQDFSSGSVNYQCSINGNTVNYTVSVTVEVNAVLEGFKADPEILYSEKTGRFYIYPTNDGFPGWGSYTFNAFSSPDLVHWTNEGEILDLSSNQVSWAYGNAWAPAIIEKKINGDYKYFYYFSGDTGSTKNIGVAVANSPTGPFVDSGAPLISQLPTGANGQLIDGDVFEDPVSGKTYFYYGNGFLAVAELNDDMVSIKPNTTSVITPAGGNLSTYDYREAAYVFYRNGLYYFLWSVDDTGSANYHVAYGTSTSPTGPINVASEPIVIIQDPTNKIYGTGHNSVLQIPGKDEWYLVYHRINAEYINSDPGTHREVCIDKLEFNPDGTIKPVTPTRQGITPVILDHVANALSVSEIDNNTNLKLLKREIYNFSGQFLGNSLKPLKKGFYIIKAFYENGTISTRKIYKNTP
ncbi:family 43 glycosylhydrolase [Neotamlana nanhaiensis]|uniref:family 43 glycosylhydrolase n=1 Tax=Neotamlana nanhaiensis TaxID=1382798 RepID=UPI00138E17CB|nr:family 43 glycosylhydrolase [Tamlana nanhaiensis]